MLNKGELITKIAERHELSKAKANRIVNDIFSTISDEVANGGSVCITNFGTFTSTERKARTVRNPQTGEKMDVEARTAPVFRAGVGFKKNVRK